MAHMLLRSLRLRSFRAHSDSGFEFGPKVNLVHGPNGAGKTNLLEAIHYLCLSKSFLTSHDTHAIRRGADYLEVEGIFAGDRRPELAVRLVYAPEEGKRIFVNRAPLERLADIVGMLPVVVLAPEDYALTAGGPEERRRFLDNTLSQARPAYLQDLMRYRRALKQRNALLLLQRRRSAVDAGTLEAWTEEIIQLGARLMWRRHLFVSEFAGFLDEAYRRIEALAETPSITYQTAVDVDDAGGEPALIEAFRERLHCLFARERERGRTLAGPHRDELVFRIEGYEVRPYASQGQHRTFALSLKLATFFFLKDHLEETPLLLLDDIFGILDPARAEIVLDLLQSEAVGQSILTAARIDAFGGVIDFDASEHRAIPVVYGRAGEDASAAI
jgi:DNA replication and repair protein RecF